MYMPLQGMSDGTEQWCPVKRGGCISEMSFNRGFTVYTFPACQQQLKLLSACTQGV